MKIRSTALFLSLLALCGICTAATKSVDPFMGEYFGKYSGADGTVKNIKALAVPEKHGKDPLIYRVRVVIRDDLVFDLFGKPEKGKVPLQGEWEGTWTGLIEKGRLTARAEDKKDVYMDLKFKVRKSPTAGLAPPDKAIVLLPFKPGTPPSLDEWTNQNWIPLPDGSMQVLRGSTRTVRKIGAARIHLEFCTPYLPHRFSQGRGNSGVYFNGSYEVQVLDSFGWEAMDNLCGGIYKAAVPDDRYAPLPPLCWQTYDVTILPARVDFNGKVIQHPLITVLHNGIPIHTKISPQKPTPGSISKNHAIRGPMLLQDHGNPVKFRNIWYVPLDDTRPWPAGYPQSIAEQLKPFDAALTDAIKTGSAKAVNQMAVLIAKTDDYASFAKPIEDRLINALKSAIALPAKQIICGQLKPIATPQAMDTLVPMLDEPKTFAMALTAMERIQSDRLDALLRNRLAKAGDNPRLELINTIGIRRDAAAVQQLSSLRLVLSKNAGISRAASRALGNIASLDAVKVLMFATSKTNGEQQRVHFQSLLRSSDVLLSEKNHKVAYGLNQWILSVTSFLPVKEAALRGLVNADEKKAGEVIVGMVGGTDDAIKGQAVSLTDRLSDRVQVNAIISQMPALKMESQVRLVQALGRRTDDPSREAILLATRNPQVEVRIAALRALTPFANENHVFLLAYTIAASRDDEQKAAADTLRRLRDPDINGKILQLTRETTGAIRAALLRSIGMRRIRGGVGLALDNATAEQPAVRAASFFALRNVASEPHMSKLVGLLLNAGTPRDAADAENAMAQVGGRINNPKTKGKAIWDVLPETKNPGKKAALIRILGKIKDKTALALFKKTLQDPDENLRLAAIGSLGWLSDPGNLADLFLAAEKDASPKCRHAALRGCLALIKLPAKRKMADTMKLLEKARLLAKTVPAKKALLETLAGYKTREALLMAESYLKDKKVAKAAKAAANQIRKALKMKTL